MNIQKRCPATMMNRNICSGLGSRLYSRGRTIGSHNGQAALHVQAKVEVVEQGGAVGVAKVHVCEAQHGRGDRVWLRKSASRVRASAA